MPLLASLCIHNERPDFLAARTKKLRAGDNQLEEFRDGLDLLAHHWRRGKRD